MSETVKQLRWLVDHAGKMGWEPEPTETVSRAADRIQALEAALKRTLVTLIAATNLLVKSEDEKSQPSKVVASDKMFLQILKDYDVATEAARAALKQD